jgi:hypothetical protein
MAGRTLSTWPRMPEHGENEPKALADLLDKLPPELTRREAANILPGLVSLAALRSLDARGKGPWAWRYTGRGVKYATKAFLAWLEDRYL